MPSISVACFTMTGAQIKAALFDGGFALKNWEIQCESNLTEVIDSVKHIKQSLNDYLTQLIDCSAKDETELSDACSDREEETEGDSVSGFIKGMSVLNHKPMACEKRKINYLCQSKKIRK